MGLRINRGEERGGDQPAIDVGCVALLAIAVLIQGLVVALNLPGRVEILAVFAAVVLLVWVAIVLVRDHHTIAVPYLAIALLAFLVIGALRSDVLTSDESLRAINSARHFLLLPTLALALAALGVSELRNRTVMLAILVLVVIQFFVTIGQALSGLSFDLIAGTFGDRNGLNMTFAVIAGACLALGLFAVRVHKAPWVQASLVALAAILPLCAVWGAHRMAIVAAPVAFLAVAVGGWHAWGAKSSPQIRSRTRVALAGSALVGTVVLLGAFGIARPSDLKLVIDAAERGDYLRHSTPAVDAGHEVPASLTSATGGWKSMNAESLGGTTEGSGRALWFRPEAEAPHAGVRGDGSTLLGRARSYSFLVAVRPSITGRYRLVAGAYGVGRTGGFSDVAKLEADGWSWLKVEGVAIPGQGAPYFSLRKAAGSFTGDESFYFDCMAAVGAETLGKLPTDGVADGCPPHYGSGEGVDRAPATEPTDPAPAADSNEKPEESPSRSAADPLVDEEEAQSRRPPGRLTQFEATQELIEGSPVTFLLGLGLGTATYAHHLGVERPALRAADWAGLSDFTTLLAELGWLGAALVALCAVALGFGSLAAARRAPDGSWTKALLIAYPGVLVAMGTFSLVSSPLRNVGSAAIFWVLTGLVLASILSQRRTDDANQALSSTTDPPS